MESEEFKSLILSEINPKTGFQTEDEYISTRDMILKVNITENVIHIWSMMPQFEYISFRETITEMQDNQSKLLQNIILQQFNLDNQTIYGDNYDIKNTLGNF